MKENSYLLKYKSGVACVTFITVPANLFQEIYKN